MSGWGVAGQVAGDLIAGQMQNRTSRSNIARGIRADARASRLNHRRQVRFAKNSLQWRVQDAKRAGLHPLAALGTQVTPYTPLQGGGSVYTGDAMPDAIRSAVGRVSDHFTKDPEGESRTRLNNAQASVLEQQAQDSLIARTAQSANARQDLSVKTPMEQITHQPNKNMVYTPYGVLPLRPWSKSQDVENETGDAGDSAWGILRLLDSVMYNMFDRGDAEYRSQRHNTRRGLKAYRQSGVVR